MCSRPLVSRDGCIDFLHLMIYNSVEVIDMSRLAAVAAELALRYYHGNMNVSDSNIDEIITYFPHWSKEEADNCWCAAFVYFCCRNAGLIFPIRPTTDLHYNLAACISWEEWARSDQQLKYFRPDEEINPQPGDIVLFDGVFDGREHDHMGVILETMPDILITAEGNYRNASAIVTRKRDEHIRCYIRFPENYLYSEAKP